MMRNLRFLATVLCLLCSGYAGAQQAMVVTTVAHEPIAAISERVMREAYRRLGRELTVVHLPGERALQAASAGEFDGDLGRLAGMDTLYPNLIRLDIGITYARFVAFGKDKTVHIDGWESLRPYSVGYLRGLKTVQTKLPADMRAEPVNTYEQLFEKLRLGRTDLVVASHFAGLSALRQIGAKNVYALEKPLEVVPLYHYLHVRHRPLVEPLTTILRQMEKEGALRDIQKQLEREIENGIR